MILHIFNHGLEQTILFTQLIQTVLADPTNNALLLLQNGVYCGLTLHSHDLAKNPKIYLLENDLITRGLMPKFNAIPWVNLINYDQFVELVLQYPKNITWNTTNS